MKIRVLSHTDNPATAKIDVRTSFCELVVRRRQSNGSGMVSDGLGLVVYEHSIFPVSFRLDLIRPSSGDALSIHLNSLSPTFLGDQIPYLFYI